MHGKLKGRKLKKQAKLRENAILVLYGLFGLALMIVFNRRGIPLKWFTATAATIIPFGLVVSLYHKYLCQVTFWMALSICLVIHAAVIWFVLGYVLSNFRNVSMLLWLPFMLAELLVLLMAVGKIRNWLAGTNEIIRLS